MVECEVCRRPIEQDDRSYQWVSGWAKKRSGGGTNAVRHMQLHPRFAHTVCVEHTLRLAGQVRLFGEDA